MATINGTPGNNTLLDITAEDDLINGLAGDDSIHVSGGRDVADGGADTDALFVDYAAVGFAVENFAENGFDDAEGASLTSVRFSNFERIDIRTGSGDDTVRTFFRPDASSSTIVSGDDFISLGSGADRAAGGDGNDALRGGAGDDVLDGDGTQLGKFGGTLGEITFSGDDFLSGEEGDDLLYGGAGSDVLNGGIGNDELYGDLSAFRYTDATAIGGPSTRIEATIGNDMTSGADVLDGGDGDDLLVGGAGADAIFGGAGNDTALVTITSDGADQVDLGTGDDIVVVDANADANVSSAVRIMFTSAEVGNGNAFDGGNNFNEDGGLAVRLQSEGYADDLVGPVSRYDDEGITFVGGDGVTFDVRDLPTGVARGDQFEVVVLGTNGADTQTAVQNARPYYFNAGMGDDSVTGGSANDFLVGGAGADTLDGSGGNDSYIGGGGVDTITDTGGGVDTIAAYNISTDGADQVNLGTGAELDVFNVSATAPTNVRVMFTSTEVGNGNALDGNNNANEDGGLAVRLQAEDGMGGLPMGGAVARVEDEGIVFVGGAGVTFDVRDLPTGVGRGENFEVVVLGSNQNDTLTAVQNARPYYFNAGMGDDNVTGGTANDFLVGGAGNDTLNGGFGNDSFIGGGGNDVIQGGLGVDTVAAFNVTTDGADRVNLGVGAELDVFNVSAAAPTNVRLMFTSAEVGNGNALDGNNNINEDGGLAVRLQAEDAMGGLPVGGSVSRIEDEGIVFVGGAGVTFDVRDLPTGVGRGENFEVVVLGSNQNDTLTAVQNTRPYYFNAGMGDDMVTGGTANDFLVGGAGIDTLDGAGANDSYIGGGGADTINDTGGGVDTIAAFNISTDGADQVNLGVGSELDVFNVSAAAATNVRLTFTSADIGNGVALDGANAANEDGGLAVRMQAEDAMGALPMGGAVTRVEDEGIVFVGGAGVTFDVRDLPSGVGRGENFEVVVLGTSGADTLTAVQNTRPYYFNAGMGDDMVTGGIANDFLVGGAGDDVLDGGAGVDSFIGGGGNDIFVIDGAGESITEAAGGGNDQVRSAAIILDLAAYANVENARLLGSLDLAISGNGANNVLAGNAGANTITGGGGRDRLIGGLGDDTFVYVDLSDSVGPAADSIVDFTMGDLIDVTAIDANSLLMGDDAFTIDALGDLSFATGHVRQTVSGADLLLEFNTDADADAEMSILLLNRNAAVTDADFML